MRFTAGEKASEVFFKCMELAVRGEEQQMEQDHPHAASSASDHPAQAGLVL